MNHFLQPSRIIVTCNRGLAATVATELQALGLPVVQSFHLGVETEGTLLDCVRLNLRLRSASQVMYSLGKFQCRGPEELYRNIKSVPWEKWIDCQGYFTVNCNVSHPTIRSSMFANVKVKDAIVDRMRGEKGQRPDSGAELLGAVVYLFWRNQEAEIFLDTSGETLAKHGYRKIPGKAPLVEALASGIVQTSRWDMQGPFVNPMCGSGTLAIEAALLATNRFPGLFRQQYAFQHLLGFDRQHYCQERNLLEQSITIPDKLNIIASDIKPEAVRSARANAQAAGVADFIDFEVCDFRDTNIPSSNNGVIAFNPEYGERLGDQQELTETYAEIGNFLKKRCHGYWGYVFTGNIELGKRVGLKPKRRIEFMTAQLDCRLFEYELYAGTRAFRQDSSIHATHPSPTE